MDEMLVQNDIVGPKNVSSGFEDRMEVSKSDAGLKGWPGKGAMDSIELVSIEPSPTSSKSCYRKIMTIPMRVIASMAT